MSERLLIYLTEDRSVAVCDRWGASSLGIAEAVGNIAKAMATLPENCGNVAEEVKKIITSLPFCRYHAVSDPVEEDCQMIVTIDVKKDGFRPYDLLDTIGRDDADIDGDMEESLPSWLMNTCPWTECVSLPEKVENLCMRYFIIPDDDCNYFYISEG